MISPASGIHRPSYNGAPAIQTMNNDYLDLPRLEFTLRLRFNVCGAAPHRSKRIYKAY